MSYAMHRYPAGYFTGIDNEEDTSVYDTKLAEMKSHFPGQVKFVELIINHIKSNKVRHSNAFDYIYDVILSGNGKSYKGGCIGRQSNGRPAADAAKLSGDWAYWTDISYVCINVEQDTWSISPLLGYLHGSNNLPNSSNNYFNGPFVKKYYPAKKMFLMPAVDYTYGVFEGLYDFPYGYYAYGGGSSTTYYGVYGNETFFINGEKYAVAYNDLYEYEFSNSTSYYYGFMMLYKITV